VVNRKRVQFHSTTDESSGTVVELSKTVNTWNTMPIIRQIHNPDSGKPGLGERIVLESPFSHPIISNHETPDTIESLQRKILTSS
jgi:hypothetical protein